MSVTKPRRTKAGRSKFTTVQQWIDTRKPSFTEADLAEALDEQAPRAAGAAELSESDRTFWDKHAGIRDDGPTIAQASAANAAARMLMDSTALNGVEVAKLLGLAGSTVRDYKTKSKLFAYERGGKSLYPTWQFKARADRVIPHLQGY